MKTHFLKKVFVILLFCDAALLQAQVPITSVSTSYVATASGHSYTTGANTYNYGTLSGTSNNFQIVNSFTISGKVYNYNTSVTGTIKLRRVNNAGVTGNRSLVWMESQTISTPFQINPPYDDVMESFFNGRSFNKGTDNLFCNAGDNNSNNIERVDWITNGAMSSNNINDAGFAIFERGADNVHDPVCIAAITSVNASGDPTGYSSIVRVATAQYGNIISSAVQFLILKKEQADPTLWLSGDPLVNSNQNRGGVFISLASLGITAGQKIYGYSLFCSDLPAGATPANLIDYTNVTYFPTNTPQGPGGIDLIAITGLFNTAAVTVLPVRYNQWSAVVQENFVQLRWTLTEPWECRAIQVQRSSDGSLWHTIALLEPQQDRYTDQQPAARNFYRLALVDLDGYTNYTRVKAAHLNGSGVFSGMTTETRYGALLLSFNYNSAAAPGTISVYDMEGKLLYHVRQEWKQGRNHFHVPIAVPQNVYVVQLSDKTAGLTRKFFTTGL